MSADADLLSMPLPSGGSNDDLSAAWAERYRVLMSRNASLVKKNKELSLRNEALQSSVRQLTSEASAASQERETLAEAKQAAEDKLASCKSVLRSEREAASFHAHKHLASAESDHMSALNKLKAEHDTLVEGLERSLAEARKRAKTLQLVAHGVQGKLDAKTTEHDKLERDSSAHIEQLQHSLSTSVAQCASGAQRIARCEALLRDREAELRSTYAKLSETLGHAEGLGSELVVAQNDRAEILRAFRALQSWTDTLLSHEGQLGAGLRAMQQDTHKIKQADEQYTAQLRTLQQERKTQQEDAQQQQQLQQQQPQSMSASPDVRMRSPPGSPSTSAASRGPLDRSRFSPSRSPTSSGLTASSGASKPDALQSSPVKHRTFSPSSTSRHATPLTTAAPTPQHTQSGALLPQSTMLRQALLQTDDEVHVLRSPAPLASGPSAPSATTFAQQHPSARWQHLLPPHSSNGSDLPPSQPGVSFAPAAASPSPSPLPLSASIPASAGSQESIALLQERLRRLNAQAQRL
jgi:hypothetical protein